MRKILSLIVGLFFVINISQADETLNIEKQLVGVVERYPEQLRLS